MYRNFIAFMRALLRPARTPASSGGLGRPAPARETPAPTGSRDPFDDPDARLQEARTRGHGLLLPVRMETLNGIRDWLETNEPLNLLDPGSMHVLAAALHEAAANIVEHGYGGNREEDEFQLWWVPGPGPPRPDENHRYNPLQHSYFLILDQGRPFAADDWEETDFKDPEAWRRGRGLGLEIIFRAMTHVAYRPATSQGNITLLAFDPGGLSSNERRLRHA